MFRTHWSLLVPLVVCLACVSGTASAESVGIPGVRQEFRGDTLWFRQVQPGQMDKTHTVRITRPNRQDEVHRIPPNCELFAANTVFGRYLTVYHFATITTWRVRADSTVTSYEEPKKTVLTVKYVKGIRVTNVDADGAVRDWTPADWLPKAPKSVKVPLPAAPDTSIHKK